MPDGSIWLIKNGKPFGLFKFEYMGIHFWKSVQNEDIIELISKQIGITFYKISKELMYKMMMERNDEFTTDDIELLKECSEVWLEKNV